MTQDKDFLLIKKALVDKVNDIGQHIEDETKQREEVSILLGKLSLLILGDATIYPPVRGIIEIYDARLKVLEEVEKNRKINKETMIKMATGSITIAVGGAVIWFFNVVKVAFIRGGNH